MKPISFECRQTLHVTPKGIAQQILDLTRWPEFQGYGPIPEIKAAKFEI